MASLPKDGTLLLSAAAEVVGAAEDHPAGLRPCRSMRLSVLGDGPARRDGNGGREIDEALARDLTAQARGGLVLGDGATLWLPAADEG